MGSFGRSSYYYCVPFRILYFAAFYLGVGLLQTLYFATDCGDAVPVPLQTFFEEKSLTKNLFAPVSLLLFFRLS